MYAVGKITNQKSASGHKIVHLAWDKSYGMEYCLSNEDELPHYHIDFGLFRFEKADQFCSWVDVSKLKIEPLSC